MKHHETLAIPLGSLTITLAALLLGACASVSSPETGLTAGPLAADESTQAYGDESPGEDAGDEALADAADQAPSFDYRRNARFGTIAEASPGPDRDRAAILAMQGEYRVSFDFEETVALAAGYERHEPKHSGGYETVVLVEDQPGRIVLQHILVAPNGFVTKHWRQDWIYEATQRFEFIADQTWQVQDLDPEQTAGAWTQCVYEVSDAPRYCGTGRWNHRYGVSTWTSDRSWRPLPRREYTVRSDYNALNVENRHTITPNGWTHEQDNTKVLRDGTATEATLVREFGFNDYRNIEGFDFSPAYDYWSRTAPYWAEVRSAWEQRLASGQTLRLKTTVDGMAIIGGTFGQAERAQDTAPEERQSQIETLLRQWTEVAQNGAEDGA